MHARNNGDQEIDANRLLSWPFINTMNFNMNINTMTTTPTAPILTGSRTSYIRGSLAVFCLLWPLAPYTCSLVGVCCIVWLGSRGRREENDDDDDDDDAEGVADEAPVPVLDAQPVQVLPKGWTEHRDAESGKTYFASPTGKTQWNAPCVETRVAPDGQRYSHQEFLDFFGRETQEWCHARVGSKGSSKVSTGSRKCLDGLGDWRTDPPPCYYSTMGGVLAAHARHNTVILIDVANAPSGLRMILGDAQVKSKMAAGQLKVECFVRCDTTCGNVRVQLCEVKQLAQEQLALGNANVKVVSCSIAQSGPEADDKALVDAAEQLLAQDDAPFVVVLSADRFRHALDTQRGVLDAIRDGQRGVQVRPLGKRYHKSFETVSPVRDDESHVAIKTGGLKKDRGKSKGGKGGAVGGCKAIPVFGWFEHVDRASGRVYFHNAASGAVQWDRPTE